MQIPQIHFHDEPLIYDGTQLRSHFAYRKFGVRGDCIVAFRGACDVKTNHLVDLEDAQNGRFIYSEDMLHFIVEHFHTGLSLTIALQRLLITNIIDEIHDALGNTCLTRRGNDIYQDTLKLSVSIASASKVSCLIHVGVNVSSKNTPVPTCSLEDLALNPRATATGIMNRYRNEISTILWARAKVRGVE